MKTDNFDEAFRRKVESFHPPFRDDEIDRIQGYVNQHIPLSFWQRFGHTLTYSLGTVVIVSLLTTTLFQANENKTLLKQISDLNNKLEQKQAINAVTNAPKQISIEKTDTVYVVKHITKEVPVYDENSSPKPSIGQPSEVKTASFISEENAGLDANEIKKDDVQEVSNLTDVVRLNERETTNKQAKNSLPNAKKAVVTSPTKAGDIQQVYKLSNATNATEKSVKEHIITNHSNANAVLERNDFKQESNQSKTKNSNSLVENNLADNTQQVENLLNKNLQENSNKQLIINDLKRKIFSPVDLKFAFDFSNRKFQTPNYIPKSKEHKSFKFPSIAMPNLKYRVGLGTNIDFGQTGASILTDVLFAKRWSITSGLNISFLGSKRFGNEDNFKRKTDKDFRNEYPVNIPVSNSIENIETHQFLFRVPIYLNYRLPLRRDYTALFSTGTDLDFHLKEFTSYSHYNTGRDDEFEGIEENIPVTAFNNWMISVGIEKRWKHFSLQANPYFNYQIKQLSYRKDDFVFGLKLNGFYRLSR